ncbi:MAG: recombination-associated protein RdgC [Desulfovibrio sp.]|jgi:DNA recombination-dependent growth factor C|nr:recombination-associated protein RdgC [Desulfovibrio sp.]
MSFLKTSSSFTRFRIVDPVPQTLWGEIPDRLRRNCFTDIDELPEERSFGWTTFEDILNTVWDINPVEKGSYLTFCLRLDTRRVPPAVIKKHLALALMREESHNREQGRKFISRERKKEIKEQVMLRLRMRFLPIPAEFQVVWNTVKSILYFASTQQKMLDLFEDLFIRTFELHIVPLSPYELALMNMEGASSALQLQLDALEPTRFA